MKEGWEDFFHELFLKKETGLFDVSNGHHLKKKSCYNSQHTEKKKTEKYLFCKYFVKWKNYRHVI